MVRKYFLMNRPFYLENHNKTPLQKQKHSCVAIFLPIDQNYFFCPLIKGKFQLIKMKFKFNPRLVPICIYYFLINFSFNMLYPYFTIQVF